MVREVVDAGHTLTVAARRLDREGQDFVLDENQMRYKILLKITKFISLSDLSTGFSLVSDVVTQGSAQRSCHRGSLP